MTYSEACAYIASIPRFAAKNRPENTAELLRRLGHPEDACPVIHVAGTNGKGSVCAFLESIFRESGLRTGLFTSPHLVDIRERFQISRRPVSRELFTEAFSEVSRCVEQMERDGYPHPAYFEFLFAMGMWIFRREKIDILVMETGLGGRLDATNSVRHPVLTVITSISFDHTEYLGNTIRQIAGEKAGIIKPGVPVVADGFSRETFDVREALDVIRERAAAAGAPLTVVKEKGRDRETDPTGEADRAGRETVTGGILPGSVRYLENGISFRPDSLFYDRTPVRVPFSADYQVENCLTAMTAAAVLGRNTGTFSEETVREGIRKTGWAGRMETVLPDVVVDGAHNEDGIRQFLRTVSRTSESRPAALLFSAVSDKKYEKMIRMLCGKRLFDYVVTTETGGERRTPAGVLAEAFRAYTDVPVTACPCVKDAVRTALARKGNRILYCTGSLYLAGEIESEIRENKEEYDQFRGRTQKVSSVDGCK